MIASGAVGDLLAITARLIACIEREIALLRAMRPQEMQALQIDKAALADAYEAHLRVLRQGESAETAISEPLRRELMGSLGRNDRLTGSEPLRRSLLECVGYLAAAGAPIVGHFLAQNPDHELMRTLLRALPAQQGSWSLVEVAAAA